MPEENDIQKLVRPAQSSFDQWGSPYCNRDVVESKRSCEISTGTSKVLRQKQSNDEASNLMKGNQANEPNIFKPGNIEAPKAMGDDAVELEEIKIHISKEIGSPQVNRKLVTSILDCCSAATMVNHSFVTNSGETEVRISTIEGHDYNISWDNTVNTNTDDKKCMEFHPPGKY